MRLLRVYIKDFMCYNYAFIDCTQFSTALVVGKKEHNDNISNGVGKTTIFKSIEYALFNHSDVNLENIIRDEAESCQIVIDFEVNNQEYRVSRTRTKKTTDLSLYQKKNDLEVHILKNNQYELNFNNYQDISGRRAADTEKELNKLIKINIKSFRIFVHFMQHDFSGLTKATAEKRKTLLKEALNLSVYSKLEKLAKDKFNTLSKEADKYKILIDNIGNPDINNQAAQFSKIENDILNNNIKLSSLQQEIELSNNKINSYNIDYSNLEKKFSELVINEQNLTQEKSKLEISVKEYKTKKANIIKAATDLVAEIKQLEDTQAKLINLDYSQIEILANQIISNKEKIAQLNLIIQNDILRIEKLKKPIPLNGECEECRQIITAEHRQACQTKLDQEKLQKQNNLSNCKKEINKLNNDNNKYQLTINELNNYKQQLENINIKLTEKKKEIIDKKTTHNEYSELLNKFLTEFQNKEILLEEIKKELLNSPIDKAKDIEKLIKIEKEHIDILNIQISSINKENAHFSNTKAVIQHDLTQKKEALNKKETYCSILEQLENKLYYYPDIIQAFSSIGIPNLIIQNVLDDLQIEANNLLAQLKPEIQLFFSIEKTNGDGIEVDTLDITYMVNGKKRYYEQLSGAMQLAATFSLKLGLSFLLQKMMGIDIKFLLLDEIDQSLDKASVDAFADIVKFFQKDFTILVITHNDRLKDKFSHAILVEQDIEMISTAKVVSSW